MEEVGHGLSVDVSGGRGQRRVNVGVGVDPHDRQLPHCRGVTVDGADGQTEQQNTHGRSDPLALLPWFPDQQ